MACNAQKSLLIQQIEARAAWRTHQEGMSQNPSDEQNKELDRRIENASKVSDELHQHIDTCPECTKIASIFN